MVLVESKRETVPNHQPTQATNEWEAELFNAEPRNCGYPDAQCKSFRLVEQSAVADLRFPVRLEALAQKWARHVMYEPEVCCMANFYLKHPRSRVQVWASGKVRIAGTQSIETAREVMRRMYSILREFAQ